MTGNCVAYNQLLTQPYLSDALPVIQVNDSEVVVHYARLKQGSTSLLKNCSAFFAHVTTTELGSMFLGERATLLCVRRCYRVPPAASHSALSRNLFGNKSPWLSSLCDPVQRMMGREPSQRPCLGMLLVRKRRAGNERVRDGANPAYGGGLLFHIPATWIRCARARNAHLVPSFGSC